MTALSSRQSYRRARRMRLHVGLFLFLLLSGLPALSQPAAAQPLCLNGKIWDEATGACVQLEAELPADPTPTTASVDIPAETDETPTTASVENPDDVAIDEEDTAGVQAADDPATPDDDAGVTSADTSATATATIGNYVCPEDFDAYNAALESLQAACTQYAPDVQFSLAVDGVGVASGEMPGADHLVLFVDVPIGTFTLTQVQYAAFGIPVVGCYVRAANGLENVREYATYPVQGNSVTIEDVEAGQSVYCNWFNVPASDTARVFIEKLECPATFDATIAGPDDLKQHCPFSTNPVEFQLQHKTAGIALRHTTPANPTVLFDRVTEGEFTITETLPAGFGSPIVYCETLGPNNQTIRHYDRSILSGPSSISTDTQTLNSLSCDWYNIPGNLTVAAGGGRGDGGGVKSEGLPAIKQDDNGDVDPPDVPPDPGTADISIVSHVCPDGFDAANASAIKVNQTCPYTYEEIAEYSLTDGAGSFFIEHTGLKEPLVEFRDIGAGNIRIIGSPPPGYGDAVIYCQVLTAPGADPTPYEKHVQVAPGVIEHQLVDGAWLGCDWFHVSTAPFTGGWGPLPGKLPVDISDISADTVIANDQPDPTPEGGTVNVSIIAYDCPASLDAARAGYVQLTSACSMPETERGFQVVQGTDKPSVRQTTNGLAVFDGLAAGDITITATATEGYGEPIVRCAVYGPDGQTLRSQRVSIVSDGSSVSITAVPDHASVLCEWFNVPEPS